MVKKFATEFRARLASLRENESGMEAAQVILILAIVVVVLIPVINLIVTALKNQGNKVVSGINAVQ